MPTIYQTFNIDSNTSMLLLNTTNLPNNNDIVVLLSNTNLPGRIVSVRDTTGNLSTTKRVVVSTVGGVTYLDGASSTTLNQPYAFITVANRDPSTWVLENTFAFPAQESAASVESVSAKYIIVSTIQAQYVFSTTAMVISSLNVENVVTSRDLAGLGNLYISSPNIVFNTLGNAAIANAVYIGSSLSTAVDLFVGRHISSFGSFSAEGSGFFGGFLSTVSSVATHGNLTVAGNTLVSSFSTIGRIGFGSDVLMTAWNLRANSTLANTIVGSNSVSTTSLFANNAFMSNVSSYGPFIGFGSDVLMTQSQLRAASTLATTVVASNAVQSASTFTSSLTVYGITNLSSLSTIGSVGFGGDVYVLGSGLYGSDIRASTMLLSNTLVAPSTVISSIYANNLQVVSSLSTTGATVGFGNNVTMGGFLFTAGSINASTIVASNSLTTSTVTTSSTLALSLVIASTTTLSGRTVSTIRFEGGQAVISSFAGDGSQMFNLAAVSSLSLQSTIVGLGQIYTSAAGAGVNQTQLVSTNIGLGTFGYISSAAAISGSFITPQNMETGLSTQQLYVSDITLSNAIYADYPSGNPPNPVAFFNATGGGSVYMKIRSGATNELYYGVDGTGNAVIYSQWPGLQLQPLNMFGSLITANATEFQVTASGPGVTPLTRATNTYVSASQLYASSATFTKVIADGSLLSNLPLSTIATFTSNTARGVSSLHGVVSSGLSSVALFTSNTSNFFAPLANTNISSGFSTLALFTSNTALGVSSLHGVVSSGLSTVALFTSNTSNFFAPLTNTNISSGFSTLANFTSNTALGVSSLHGVVSSGLSTIGLFTSNTSNFAVATSNYAANLLQNTSSWVSSVALFTSNTSNFAAGTSNYAVNLLQNTSSWVSSVALFTSNTSNFYLPLTRIDISTGLSTVATGGGGYVSTLSSAIGTQFLTSNLLASTMKNVVIQPSTSNQWVAVGSNSGGGGTNILYSFNGVSWTGGTTNNFSVCGNAVAYGNGLWVAVGRDATANNTIKYSVDGVTWSNISGGGGGFTTEGFDVKFNGKIWVAVGTDATTNNTIKYSLNGISWSNSSGSGFAGGQGTGVAWNGQMWVAGGIGTTTQNWLKYSFDGITWSNANSIQDTGNTQTSGFQGRWDGKQWLWAAAATGGTNTDHLKWSLDGSNWFNGGSVTIGTNFWNVNTNGFIYIYPGWGTTQNNCVAYSTAPLSNLQFVNTNFTAAISLYAGAVWNGYYWVMGGRVTLAAQSNATLEISADGITWTNTTGVGFTSETRGLAYTSNLPVYRQTNLDILEQNIPMSITSTNQFLFAQSSMVLNNTLRVDALGRVGINSNIPQFSLDVNGTAFLSTVQTTSLSTRQILVSSLGVNCNAPMNMVDVNGPVFFSTTQTTQLSTLRTFTSSLGVGTNAPQFIVDARGIVRTSGYFLGDSTDDMIASGIKQLIVPGGQNFGYGISTGIYFSKGVNNNYSGLNFLTTSNLVTVSSLTMAAATGFVGINCNSPANTLEVNGTAFLSTTQTTLLSTQRVFASSIGVGFTAPRFTLDVNGTTNLSTIQNVRIAPSQTNLWVAVGSGGSTAASIKYSSDGLTWTNSSSGGFSSQGFAVAWNGTLWVAVGNGGSAAASIQYSRDGINWTNSSSGGFSTEGAGVAWNGRIWVAVGNGGSAAANIQYSTDGINWTNSSSGGFSSYGTRVAWNGYIWIAVGSGGSAAANIKYSVDGINWTNSSSGGFSTEGGDVAWNGTFWVAVGNGGGGAASIKYSTDGINWTNSSSGGFASYGFGVAWNGNLWVATGAGGSTAASLKYSRDGITWLNSASGGFSTYGLGVAWNGRIWVATGVGAGASTNIQYSTDGVNWNTSSSGGFSGYGRFAAYSSNLTAGYSQENLDIFTQNIPINLRSTNQILTAPSSLLINNTLQVDGLWDRVGVNSNTPQYTLDVNGSANFSTLQNVNIWPNQTNLWVAAGYDSTSGRSLRYSTDGITWSLATNSFTSIGQHVAWNGNMWVAVGQDSTQNNRIKYSYDGISWSNSAGTGFTTRGFGVAWNGRIWVAVGQDSTQNNTIKYSTDGITWTNSSGTGFTSYGFGVGWNGRMWVAGGADSTANNTIKYSYDGINWSNSASGGFTTEGHYPVWNGRMWVIGGSDSTAANRIKYSYDGINWSNSIGGDTFSQSAGGYAPAWNGDLWLIGGYNNALSNGIIKWSRDGITWSNVTSLAASDGCLGIAWNGRLWVATCDSIPNGTVSQVYSTDGLNWTAGTGQFSFHGYGVAYSSNLVPSYRQANLDILPQNIDYTLRSTNTIFLAPSSLVLNDTLRVDMQWLRVGVNSNTPQYDLDVNGRMRSRIIISNVTGTSLTSATSPAISAATFGIYYNITNSGFNALTVPTLSNQDTGSFWLLRNNTASALSITVTGAVSGIPPSPLSIPASNSAIVSWSGSAFVMF